MLETSVIAYNNNLEKIVIPEVVSELKENLIQVNPMLLIVHLPSTLTNVSAGSVSQCSKIFYVSHFHKELIGAYHEGGFPLKALMQLFKCAFTSFVTMHTIKYVVIYVSLWHFSVSTKTQK